MFTKAHAKGEIPIGSDLQELMGSDAPQGEPTQMIMKVEVPHALGVCIIGAPWLVRDNTGNLTKSFKPTDEFRKAMGSDFVGYFLVTLYRNGTVTFHNRVRDQAWVTFDV